MQDELSADAQCIADTILARPSRMALSRRGLLPLEDLPNSPGLAFLGVDRTGQCIPCTVRRDATTGLHRIEGSSLANLIGWKRP